VIVRVFFEVKPELISGLVVMYECFVLVNVLEESAYKVLMAVVAEETGLGNFYDLKRAWEKCAVRKGLENAVIFYDAC